MYHYEWYRMNDWIIVFAQALIRDERTNTFEWVLGRYKTCMQEKDPITIFTCKPTKIEWRCVELLVIILVFFAFGKLSQMYMRFVLVGDYRFVMMILVYEKIMSWKSYIINTCFFKWIWNKWSSVKETS